MQRLIKRQNAQGNDNFLYNPWFWKKKKKKNISERGYPEESHFKHCKNYQESGEAVANPT